MRHLALAKSVARERTRKRSACASDSRSSRLERSSRAAFSLVSKTKSRRHTVAEISVQTNSGQRSHNVLPCVYGVAPG